MWEEISCAVNHQGASANECVANCCNMYEVRQDLWSGSLSMSAQPPLPEESSCFTAIRLVILRIKSDKSHHI